MAEHSNSSTDNQRQYELKNITGDHLQERLREFKKEFKKFDPKARISTPQADHGIGPVQYNLRISDRRSIPADTLKKLTQTIKYEKETGDALIKFDASLLYLATGSEDPKAFLPPGCRAAIRTEIKETTSKIVQEHGLAYKQKDNDAEAVVYQLIREAESQFRPANPAEVALICDVANPRDETGLIWANIDSSYNHIKEVLAMREQERKHIRRIRKLIRREFNAGATAAMSIADDDKSDETTDMLEKN